MESLELQKLNESLELPKSATWEITRRCNMSCPHCFNSSELRNSNGLSLKKSLELIDKVDSLDSVTNFVITGGEPLIRRDVAVITKYARERFEKLVLQTNGYFIPSASESLLKSYDEITISIYGPYDVDKSFKGVSKTNIPQALSRLRQLKIPFSLSTVMMTVTKDNMEYLYNFARQQDAFGLTIQEFVPLGRGRQNKNLFVAPEQNLEIKKRIKEVDKNNFVTFNGYSGCGGGTIFLEINYMGDVSPCTFRTPQDNLFYKDLEDIWYGSRSFQDFREFKKGKELCPMFYEKYYK